MFQPEQLAKSVPRGLVKHRHGRRAIAASLLRHVAPRSSASSAVAAQAEDPTFLVREIDGTEQKAVELTLLWTGEPADLQKLTIRENGAAVKVDDLVDLRKTDRRLATVIVVDLSGSMADDGALAASKASIAKIAENLPEGDQLALVSFTNDAVVESSFTSSPEQIKAALDEMVAPHDGRTAMYDAIRKGVSLFETRPGLQPNMLLVTDGSDDVSSTDLAGAQGVGGLVGGGVLRRPAHPHGG